MALLLVIPCWVAAISLVLTLCVAARHGDRQEEFLADRLPEPVGPARPARIGPGVDPDLVHDVVEAGRRAA